jgi:broad specificity phosphatase PhoE
VTGCILLVRHGETEWNLERRVQGRFDSPLTARGVAQAYAIGRLVQKLPDAASACIVASPLGRARRTAEIIREHLAVRPELVIDDRLQEISAGSWDGLTFCDIELRSPGIFDGDGRWEWNFRAPGGETYDTFVGRVGEWLDEWVGARFIVAVTHGVVSRVLRGLYAGLPREAALVLPVPQDKVFRLFAGSIEELAVSTPDACSVRDAAGRGGRLHDAIGKGQSG